MKPILITLQLLLLSIIVSAQKTYTLQGTIGTIPIYMNFEDYSADYPNDDQPLTGRYFYRSSLKDIVLRGTNKNNVYTLIVESGVDQASETFTLMRKGSDFFGKWVNNKGKVLTVALSPVDVESVQNPYINIDYVAQSQEKSPFDYIRSSFIKLNRDSVSQINGKSIIWFSEKHCNAPFFRLGNGFDKAQTAVINPILDGIHFEGIINQLGCSSNWHYSEGDGIEYTTTIDYLTNNLIGFEVFASWYCGGAHPDFGGTGYLLDLNTGKSYDLKDIYDLDTKTMYNVINEQEHFTKPGSDDDYCDYTDLEYWEYANWAIAKDGIRFTPSFYRAARACEDSFLVPFEKLKPYKKKSFPYNL